MLEGDCTRKCAGLCWCQGDLYGFAFAGSYGQCGWLHCDAFGSRVSSDFEGACAGVFDFEFYGFGLPHFKGSAKVKVSQRQRNNRRFVEKCVDLRVDLVMRAGGDCSGFKANDASLVNDEDIFVTSAEVSGDARGIFEQGCRYPG